MGTVQQQKGKPVRKGSHSLLKGPKADAAKKSKAGKLPSLKNKIRGVERLLRKTGSDQQIKRSLEAKLSELHNSLAKHDREATERKFAVRYHKVRFFERVKLERRIKQIEGKADRGHALSSAEQQQLKQHRDHLQYVLHFPKGKRYVSILKDAAEPAAQEQLESDRTRLKVLIRHQLAESAMLAEADEGLGQALPKGDAAHNAEADAFFLESDDSDASHQAAATEVLHVPEAVIRLPELQSPTAHGFIAEQPQARAARVKASQQPQRKRQANLLQDNGVSVKRAKHSSAAGSYAAAPVSAPPVQGAQQDRPQALQHQMHSDPEEAGSLQRAPDLSHREGLTVKHSLSDAAAKASKANSNRLSFGADKAGIASGQHSREQKAKSVLAIHATQDKAVRRSAADRSQALLQKLQQKYVKQHPVSGPSIQNGESNVVATRQPDLKTLGSHLRMQLPGKVDTLHDSFMPGHAKHTSDVVLQDKQPVRTRAQGGRKRRR